MGNFVFLKKVDKNLYDIISDAEKLYRDEYFEQSITQIRRFGEIVCKNVLGDMITCEITFDDMLATLRDKATKSIQEKEFIEDLYFIKREGNFSVHSSTVKKDGIIALECLKKAFEIAINYVVYFKKSDKNLLKAEYDIDLLITGKKSKKSLSQKYIQEKKKSKSTKPNKKNKAKNIKSQKKSHSLFKIMLLISTFISILIIFMILLLNFI